MKLTCNRAALAAAFQTVSGVVRSRTPKEILKNAKLQVSESGTVLLATDSEIGIRCVVKDVDAVESGEVLLPVSRMTTILTELRDEVVVLECNSDMMTIRAGQSEFQLPLVDPAEFPAIADFESENYYAIPAAAMTEMIRRTIFATDPESSRYALGGVLVELADDSIKLVATDSRRLSLAGAKCSVHGTVEQPSAPPVIPAKAMQMIERSLSDEDEMVELSIQGNEVLTRTGSATIYSRLVEGRFPKYEQVIPAQFNSSVDLVVEPFYAAVRQAQIVTSDESRGVDFTFSPGTLVLDSQASDVGVSHIEMPIDYDGPEVTITFDPRFVADFLKVLGPEKQITLQLIDGESAAVFRIDDDFTYVIMPLSRER